ncbi:hypothetical protein [Alicyclobacillus sp. SO9]|uniref:hypothetical protein n=1 Tax=Alicyclobacillus sp. SO9 TaxID=2665646 RepID=UPI001937E906|nr:hypothetical protein [Alicyclobacillus sp. SO9]QQE79260.1 hypothetical protein GI364_01755 [Alicyclobacillus sp. SO9]
MANVAVEADREGGAAANTSGVEVETVMIATIGTAAILFGVVLMNWKFRSMTKRLEAKLNR